MAMTSDIINTMLATYTQKLDAGLGMVNGSVTTLATTLAAIDLVLAAMVWAAGEEEVLIALAKKTLYVGFFAYLVANWSTLTTAVYNSFAQLGLTASGASLTASTFTTQPGQTAQVGIDTAGRIISAAYTSGAWWSPSTLMLEAISLIMAILIIGSFFIMAIQIFVAVVEFHIVTLAAFVLIPFGLLGRTAFLAEKALGYVVTSGVKILVLATTVGIGSGFFDQFGSTAATTDLQQTFASGASAVLGALTLLGLSLAATSLATGLASGAPQLGAAAVVGTVSAAAGGYRAVGGAAGLVTSAPLAVRAARAAAATAPGPAGSTGLRSAARRTQAWVQSAGQISSAAWARQAQHRQRVASGMAAVARTMQGGGGGGVAPTLRR